MNKVTKVLYSLTVFCRILSVFFIIVPKVFSIPEPFVWGGPSPEFDTLDAATLFVAFGLAGLCFLIAGLVYQVLTTYKK